MINACLYTFSRVKLKQTREIIIIIIAATAAAANPFQACNHHDTYDARDE